MLIHPPMLPSSTPTGRENPTRILIMYLQHCWGYYTRAYRKANGIILGKTTLAELSSSSTSINPNIPGVNILTPLNAYNQTRHTGGEPSA